LEQLKQFQEILDDLQTLTRLDKIRFLEALLFCFTIAGRGIWSDDRLPESEKVEGLKWLNELTHRVWHIRFELQEGECKDSIERLYGNLKFYREQSSALGSHLVPTTIAAFKMFKEIRVDNGMSPDPI
jgi:hypothetical protein